MNSIELIIFICLLMTSMLYGLIIILFSLGWTKLKTFLPGKPPQNFLSVIIPVRNEADKIASLIEMLVLQDYPTDLYEVIFVNDHSTDKSAEQLKAYINKENFLYVEQLLGQKGKKQALALGISQARGNIIVSSDADCKPAKGWLKSIDAHFQQGDYKMLAGPVAVENPSGCLAIFQAIEFISLQGSGAGAIGIGMPIMCNGANLAFIKTSFKEVNGYKGNEHIPGGDDIFLLEKFKKTFGSKSIGFIKDPAAILHTAAATGLNEFFKQRIRWVSKSPAYHDPFLIFTSIIVLLFNLLILLSLLGAIISYSWIMLIVAFAAIIYKSIIDLPLLYMVSGFFKQRSMMIRSYLFVQPAYILFIVISGILGNILSYQWKGRSRK